MVSQAARPGTRREWLTIHEASALIGVSPATLRRWSDAGDIKAFTTPGGHRRFSRSAVLGLLPSTRRERPNLERLGETPDRLARVYRRQIARTADATGWIRLLDEEAKVPFRVHGRRIANALLAFFDAATAEEREARVVEAEVGCAEYGRIAAEHGIPIADAVELFLCFRMPFLQELGAVARRRALDTSEATDLLETATEVIDRLLGALVRAHEASSLCRLRPARIGAAS